MRTLTVTATRSMAYEASKTFVVGVTDDVMAKLVSWTPEQLEAWAVGAAAMCDAVEWRSPPGAAPVAYRASIVFDRPEGLS